MEGVDLGHWEKRTEGVHIRELLQDAGKGEAMGKDRSALGVINLLLDTVEVYYKYSVKRGVQIRLEAVEEGSLVLGRGM
jgi:hypothetical protein